MKSASTALAIAILATGASAQVTIKATNTLPIARTSQTIELSGNMLPPVGQRQDVSFVHVKDSAGKEVLAQAVDTDFDNFHKPDIVIFQADFAPNESKTFTVSVGAKQTYEESDFKAFGRFNRERFDDFCWENDKIAHRMYGKGLETWDGEPLTSSTIDVWSKKTAKMVTDKWYMMDDYHADHGEGADFYSAGESRGIGGSGVWASDKLFVSKNFVNSRVLAKGPIRVLFELDYESWDVGGMKVSETKRISLDGGSHLDKLQSTYKIESGSGPLTIGVGMKKTNGEQREASPEKGVFAKWERVEKNAGMQGLGVIVDPKTLVEQKDDQRNWLMLIKATPDNKVTYWAGFCWDKAGPMTDLAGWKKYLDTYAQEIASPIQVSAAP